MGFFDSRVFRLRDAVMVSLRKRTSMIRPEFGSGWRVGLTLFFVVPTRSDVGFGPLALFGPG